MPDVAEVRLTKGLLASHEQWFASVWFVGETKQRPREVKKIGEKYELPQKSQGSSL